MMQQPVLGVLSDILLALCPPTFLLVKRQQSTLNISMAHLVQL